MDLRKILILVNQMFEAGIAISALSLFIRSLSFNLRDRVSRSFAAMLACVMVVFSGEAISGSALTATGIEFWLRMQWVGIVIFPAAFFHFGDALLETTGRPSRGRRSRVTRLGYGISVAFLSGLPFEVLVGPVIYDQGPVPHLQPTPLSALFTVFYLVGCGFTGWILWRAYNRTRLTMSRRRMWYLMTGALFLVLGTYPYLQLGSGFARRYPDVFMGLATLGNIVLFVMIFIMAYAVAFFGVPWPDRLVRSRLVKWVLRGPATVFILLILMTVSHEVGDFLGMPYNVTIPIITVTSVLLLEHVVTLVFPFWERWFFSGGDGESIQLLQDLSERLITTSDLRQFLEAVLAAVCDRFQVSTAFVAALSPDGIETVVQFGNRQRLSKIGLDQTLLEKVSGDQENGNTTYFAWGDFWLYPLFSAQNGELLGLLGVLMSEEQQIEEVHQLEEDDREALFAFGHRAAQGLEDRRLQRQVFEALEELGPKVDIVQRMRAATRFDQNEILDEFEVGSEDKELSDLVKDALTHYWGGPKLTESPLLGLQVVQEAMRENEGSPANALRAILREGIDRVRPEGERRFTAEWILYNILEMKFMEGRKVREVAMRLAMSEADLYRKQRVAIEEVAKAIVDMERIVRADRMEINYE